jgi:hypothetical protein
MERRWVFNLGFAACQFLAKGKGESSPTSWVAVRAHPIPNGASPVPVADGCGSRPLSIRWYIGKWFAASQFLAIAHGSVVTDRRQISRSKVSFTNKNELAKHSDTIALNPFFQH